MTLSQLHFCINNNGYKHFKTTINGRLYGGGEMMYYTGAKSKTKGVKIVYNLAVKQS